MICLDTNYLIGGLITDSPEAGSIYSWLSANEPIGIAAVSWYEFLCGPVTDEEIKLAGHILTGGIISFQSPQAVAAADLFNLGNRKRSLRVDAMIAATAITAGTPLATNNLSDFEVFVPHGLELVWNIVHRLYVFFPC